MNSLYYRLTETITGWRKALLTVFAGAIVTLALPPFDFLPAGFIGFPLLVLLLDSSARSTATGWRRLLPAFRTGWLFGFGYFLAGLWWIGMALLVDAENFAWALPLAILGLPAFLAFFFAFAAAFARIFWGAGLIRILVLAIALGITEWLRSFILTGFPWNALGYLLM
ncbi:MAG: apolipoprotein N-acyltransferase, partial [Brucellaceae bacterium]|nr:apolipoprotein N-acyltransferase [Brucellaceae bacterium]